TKQRARDRSRVPRRTPEWGEISVAHVDFLPTAQPARPLRQFADRAGGDAQGNRLEAHAALPQSDIELVVSHRRERRIEGAVFLEQGAAIKRTRSRQEV